LNADLAIFSRPHRENPPLSVVLRRMGPLFDRGDARTGLPKNQACHLIVPPRSPEGDLREAGNRGRSDIESRDRFNKKKQQDCGTKTMAADRAQNLQDTFLNHVRKTKTPLTIFLVNGVKLQGIVTWFDNFCLLLRRDGHSQLVYKHAISTIMPGAPIQLFEGGEDAPA
jgi:host factor-I protein